jgi:K+-sensing histidine kinase KdpD
MASENDVCVNLEKLINAIEAANDKIDSSVIALLEQTRSDANALNMKTGDALIGNLISKVKELNEGRTLKESVNLRITALKFYIETIKKDGETGSL